VQNILIQIWNSSHLITVQDCTKVREAQDEVKCIEIRRKREESEVNSKLLISGQ